MTGPSVFLSFFGKVVYSCHRMVQRCRVLAKYKFDPIPAVAVTPVVSSTSSIIFFTRSRGNSR